MNYWFVAELIYTHILYCPTFTALHNWYADYFVGFIPLRYNKQYAK